MERCKICSASAPLAFSKRVLFKHDVRYYRCGSCGFLFTEDPFWLGEAYGDSPVSPYDVSSPSRAHASCRVACKFINAYFPRAKLFLDYGGGTGLFVRLMRDRGFNFYRYDPFCQNVYATFFDWDDALRENGAGARADLITCFEVFEHFVSPVEEVERLLSYSDHILLSTALQPDAGLDEWFYLIPECGQHVSLHSRGSMERLAERVGCHLRTNGVGLHVLSRDRIDVDFRVFDGAPVRRPWITRAVRKLGRILDPDIWEEPIPGHRPDDYEAARSRLAGSATATVPVRSCAATPVS